MSSSKVIFISSLLVLAGAISACAGKTQYRSACAQEIDAAWSELSIAKADGFSGTVSYTKALGLITTARTMQGVENFDNCYNQAKSARFYIRESRKGQ
ncbi:hypothetical protein [Cellvibrio sp. OA-2007]|uniref:hypothetical protein n=1 Tax=Cellvibrio sp. OA-2007 TaxID=529823 RepID=UPI000782697C|nr:hypothetical protein [Cellvibrio sp. OA-2007]